MSAFSKFLNNRTMRSNALIVAGSMVFIYWSSLELIRLRNKE